MLHCDAIDSLLWSTQRLDDGAVNGPGPLGQGFCNAVGLALAEAHLGARFNKDDAPTIVDHYT